MLKILPGSVVYNGKGELGEQQNQLQIVASREAASATPQWWIRAVILFGQSMTRYFSREAMIRNCGLVAS